MALDAFHPKKACQARDHNFSYTWSEAECVVEDLKLIERVRHGKYRVFHTPDDDLLTTTGYGFAFTRS